MSDIRKVLRSYSVERAFLFGSQARGEATEYSDIDLLLLFPKSEKVGLFKIGGIQEQLTKATGKNVQVVVKPGKKFLEHINDDLRPVYEKE